MVKKIIIVVILCITPSIINDNVIYATQKEKSPDKKDKAQNEVKIDPFSKIEIKSKKLNLKSQGTSFKKIILEYVGNVTIKFADNSKIYTPKMLVSLNSTQKNKNLNSIEYIQFPSHIKFESDQHKVEADNAEFQGEKNEFYFRNNVKIIQISQEDKKPNINATCDYAIFNLTTKQLKLNGDKNRLINTTITFNKKRNS